MMIQHYQTSSSTPTLVMRNNIDEPHQTTTTTTTLPFSSSTRRSGSDGCSSSNDDDANGVKTLHHHRQSILSTYSIPLHEFTSLPDVSKGDEEVHEMECCIGLKFSWLWFVLFWLGVVLSLGTLLLLCFWFDWLKDRIQYNRIYKKKKENGSSSSTTSGDDVNLNNNPNNNPNNNIFHNTSFKNADAVLIKSKETKQITICKIEQVQVDDENHQVSIRLFKYRNLNYIYNDETDQFQRVHHNTLVPFSSLHDRMNSNHKKDINNTHNNNNTKDIYNNNNNTKDTYNNNSNTNDSFLTHDTSRHLKKSLFGVNTIETPVRNVISLLLDEVLHPFYLFQVASVCVWLSENYYVYAVAIAVISSISSLLSMWETRSNMIKLKEMTSFHCGVNRLLNLVHGDRDVNTRNGTTNRTTTNYTNITTTTTHTMNTNTTTTTTTHIMMKHRIDSTQLLPGDLIEIENEMILPCDCVLLFGSVIMNESMLTGESTPTKV